MTSLTAWVEPGDRTITRMAGVAGALPGCVASRDRKGVGVLFGRVRTVTELQAVAVILASWLAEAEAELAQRSVSQKGRAAA